MNYLQLVEIHNFLALIGGFYKFADIQQLYIVFYEVAIIITTFLFASSSKKRIKYIYFITQKGNKKRDSLLYSTLSRMDDLSRANYVVCEHTNRDTLGRTIIQLDSALQSIAAKPIRPKITALPQYSVTFRFSGND